jgi:hypothetical protein
VGPRECLDVLEKKTSLATARIRDSAIYKFKWITLCTLCPTVCVSEVNRNTVAITYYFTIISLKISQECTNPGHSVALVSKFPTTVPNICGTSIKNLLQATFLVFGILKWVVEF